MYFWNIFEIFIILSVLFIFKNVKVPTKAYIFFLINYRTVTLIIIKTVYKIK
jgi:hypothetical protein